MLVFCKCRLLIIGGNASIRRSGSTSWDQFSLNKEKFGIDSHFNEELYTIPMSSLQINKDEWEEAVSAAREIEGNESERGGYLLLL